MGDWKVRAKAAAFGLVALTALGGAQGCAAERDPINRVQLMAVPKSIFVRPDAAGRYLVDSDSWYFRAIITDVPSSQAVGFVGAATDMYRMKWRIEENILVAYREDPDILNSGDPSGGTVAAFPITSHFDIRRDYNPTTGEEANVVVENTTDRPWDQREYFRIDWSNNLLEKRNFTSFGFDELAAVKTYTQDPESPDHPIFEDGYVDISAKYTVRPDIRTCFYLYRDFGCGQGDITARLSFMKVPDRDYEPREYPDRLPLADNDGNPIRTVSGNQVSLPMMDQFGYFRTERAVYDQRYGTLEKRFLYRANVWNLWEQWFARDDKGNVLKFENGDNVPLRYKDRKVRPIVYFLNKEWPEELKGIAQLTADGWNDAFAETVASLRLLEDLDYGVALRHEDLRREVDAMKSRDVGYGPQFGERVYVLCPNNPVKAGDHPACGKEGSVARQGDLRYSFMHWVPKPQPSGPLGFGPSYGDPITGQLFSANAYIYGAALDVSAQNATDIVNLLNGKYKEFDYANGIATDDYVRRLVRGEVPGPTGSARAGLEGMTPGRADFQLGKTQGQVDKMVDRPLLQTIAKKGVPLAVGPSGQDRLNMIRGTGLERKLLDNPETHLLVGKTPDQALTDADIKSIGDVLLQGDIVKKENERLSYLGKHGCYMEAAMVDDSVIGLAREMAKKHPGGGTAPEQEAANKNIWQEMRQAILRGVLEHEVGHTVGLRHNFEGSSDALNFHDQFWNLKSESLTYGAPMTENQKNGKMTELQYTTVMDYGARFNSDVHGLGKYDHAAIRFGYGNLVESFPKGKIKDKLYNAAPDQFGNGFFVGYSAEILDGINRSYRHYTQIPSEFEGGIDAIKTSSREIRPFADVVENARSRYLKQIGNTSLVKTNAASGGVDVVPYQYCGDEFAGSANRPLCQRWDQGMDSFEVVSDAMGRYQQYYIFDAFTRGKAAGFNQLSGYLGKIATRYFSHVHSQYIHWLFYQGTFDYYWRSIFGGENGVKNGYISNADWFKDPAGGLPSTLATTWGLDRLIDVLGTPDVGVYIPNQDHAQYADNTFFEQATSSPYACTNAQGGTAKCDSNANQLTLDIDNGARYRFTRYDNSTGQGFFNRIKNIGSFYDKIAALLMLTNSETNFVGQDQTNAVSYRIGFYLAYPKALSSIFGGVATDTYDNYAWRYDVPSTSAFGGAGDAGQVKLLTTNVFQSMGGGDNVTTPAPGTLKGKPIDGGWYFFYKAYAMYFSMAEFQSNFSQSWNDASRVWCLGCGEAFTPAENTTPIMMSDPLSGKQYGALVYGDGRYSPGAEFIRQGQKLVTGYEEALAAPQDKANREYYINRARARLQDHVELMDLIRGLYQVYGYTRF
ncbi:MAG: zinc-dependent metalloprotease [Labilithrix sp.]|nr:zinc-dependent metalloprotease [Labilithrix sp.]